jgi:hypothetical protein
VRSGGFFIPIAVVIVAAASIIAPRTPVRSQAPQATGATAGQRPNPADKTKKDTDLKTPADVLAQFFGIDTETVPADQLIPAVTAAAAHHDYKVDALIVTAPDPIDSYARWLFDPLQNAVEAAAASNDYVLDRFFIPDWNRGARDDEAHPRLGHENNPGVILFRKDTPDGQHALLLVLLVFETPTEGLHLGAFKKAVAFLQSWPPTANRELKVLGPTFSGTSPSLRVALQQTDVSALVANAGARVVTGTATSPSNKSLIESANPDHVRFSALVTSNQDMLLAAVRRLLDSESVGVNRLALLIEENTAYGRSAGAALPRADRSAASGGGKAPDDDVTPEELVRDALRIRFPLHVSRVRSEYSDDARAQGTRLRTTPPVHALSLRDEGPVTDRLPMFGQETSTAYVELALTNIFDAIRREHISAIGVVATDTRDKLYLSRLLSRYCPTVRQFTIEGDLLYTHPDYGGDMRGALVAAPYPLHTANQLWTWPAAGAHERRLFPISSAQGTFNAFQVLLNEAAVTPNSDPMTALGHMTDYGSPFATRCGGAGHPACAPPVWISVVGRDALWPVAVQTPGSKYVMELPGNVAAHSDDAPTRRRMVPIPLQFWLLALTLHLAAWASSILYLKSKRHGEFFARHANPRRYLVAMFAGLLLMVAYVDVLLWIWNDFVWFERPGVRWFVRLLCTASVALPTFAIWKIARRRFALARATSAGTRPLTRGGWTLQVYRGVFIALLVASIGCLMVDLYGNLALAMQAKWASAPDVFLVLLLERSVHLASGVSPATPVMLLCGALALWGLQNFRTRGVPSHTILDKATRALDRVRLSDTAAGTVHATPRADVKRLRQLRLGVFTVGLIVQIVYYFGYHAVSTVESVGYTLFFSVITVLLQGLIAVSIVQFLFIWVEARAALERVAESRPLRGALRDAFARLPSAVRQLGVFTHVPRLRELETSIAKAERIGAVSPVGASLAFYEDGVMASTLGATPGLDATVLTEMFKCECEVSDSLTYSDSATWGLLVDFAVKARQEGAALQQQVGNQLTTAVQEWFERIDELSALTVVLISRELSGRLIASILLTTAMTLMVLGSHTLYPAQPRPMLLAFSWASILGSVAGSVAVFVQMDRNEVLSYVAGTRPNRLEWNFAFVSKLALWVAIPLLSLFAAQFPDAGGAILDWLQPVQKALP